MNTFSASSAVRFGWETFKRRGWFLVGATFLVLVFLWVINILQGVSNDGNASLKIITFLAVLGASTLLDMGLTAFLLRAHDDITAVSINDLWHPRSFWQYLVASLLVGFSVFVGFILLIVPGIMCIILFAFVKLLVIDRNLGPIAAMKESARITKGNRLEIFLLLLTVVGLNILGALPLLLGLLVTLPVSMLAIVHTYRTLANTPSI